MFHSDPRAPYYSDIPWQPAPPPRHHGYPHPSRFHQPPMFGWSHDPYSWQYYYANTSHWRTEMDHPPHFQPVPLPEFYPPHAQPMPHSPRSRPRIRSRSKSHPYGQHLPPPQESCRPSPSHHYHRPRAPIRPLVSVSRPLESADSVSLSLVSYNVLSQDLIADNPGLYTHCPQHYLDWEFRKGLLMAELVDTAADILCLQEVNEDHLESWFKPQLATHGYAAIYQKRTGAHHKDGCAIFYRHSKLKLLEWNGVKYQKCITVLNRDNVGLVAKFQINSIPNFTSDSVDDGIIFCVATTHLLFNPRAGHVKLAQLSCLFAELHRLAASSPSGTLYPALLCGDFNSVPNSPLLQFLENSRLNYSSLTAREIAGYFHGPKGGCVPSPLLPPFLRIGPDCKYTAPPRENELANKEGVLVGGHSSGETSTTGQDTSGIAKQYFKNTSENSAMEVDPVPEDKMAQRADSHSHPLSHSKLPNDPIQNAAATRLPAATITHPFNFISAYPHPFSGHPLGTVTTYHQSAFETVDYIFCTPARAVRGKAPQSGFHLLSRKALPSTHTLLELGPQPHQFLSSDHLILQAKFQLLA